MYLGIYLANAPRVRSKVPGSLGAGGREQGATHYLLTTSKVRSICDFIIVARLHALGTPVVFSLPVSRITYPIKLQNDSALFPFYTM